MMHTTRSLIAAIALGLSATLVACAATVSGATSSSTTGSTTPTTPTAPVNGVNDLRVVGAPVVSSDVPVAFRLVDSGSAAADVVISFSLDAGQTWSVTTEGPGSSGTSGLATGPNLGIEHIYVWDSGADVATFEADVRIRIDVSSGQDADSAAFAVDNQPLSTTVQLNRHPWLQNMTQTSAIVLWRTTGSTDTVIEYGSSASLGLTAGDPNASTDDHQVTLSGLQPGTRYTYRVLSGGQPVTTRTSFVTAPASTATTLTFLAFGDSGTGSAEQFAVADQMAQDDADFVLHLGDILYPDGGAGNIVPEYNRLFFEPYRNMLDTRCMFPAPGNHDRHDFFKPYRETFITPNNGLPLIGELYYSFEWANAKFIMLDSTYLFRYPLGPQMTWLMRELTTNTKKWLIVYLHHPLYSGGSHGDDATMIAGMGPIFEHNGVDLVLSGHEHNYERTVPMKQFNQDPAYPGLTYLVSGGGGTNIRTFTGSPNTAVGVSAHHYVKITIQGDTLVGNAIDLNGQLLDSFAILNR
jgi:hypothetical protein